MTTYFFWGIKKKDVLQNVQAALFSIQLLSTKELVHAKMTVYSVIIYLVNPLNTEEDILKNAGNHWLPL